MYGWNRFCRWLCRRWTYGRGQNGINAYSKMFRESCKKNDWIIKWIGYRACITIIILFAFQGVPILIFANKQDLPGAKEPKELERLLGLHELSFSTIPTQMIKSASTLPVSANISSGHTTKLNSIETKSIDASSDYSSTAPHTSAISNTSSISSSTSPQKSKQIMDSPHHKGEFQSQFDFHK